MDGRERLMLAEAAVLLGVSRLVVILVPFRYLVRESLRGDGSADGATATVADRATIDAVGRVVARAARHVPWNAVCLPQAMAAKAMLRRRRIAAALHLGAGFDASGKLVAHAWVISHGAIVTGESGISSVTPLVRLE